MQYSYRMPKLKTRKRYRSYRGGDATQSTSVKPSAPKSKRTSKGAKKIVGDGNQGHGKAFENQVAKTVCGPHCEMQSQLSRTASIDIPGRYNSIEDGTDISVKSSLDGRPPEFSSLRETIRNIKNSRPDGFKQIVVKYRQVQNLKVPKQVVVLDMSSKNATAFIGNIENMDARIDELEQAGKDRLSAKERTRLSNQFRDDAIKTGADPKFALRPSIKVSSTDPSRVQCFFSALTGKTKIEPDGEIIESVDDYEGVPILGSLSAVESGTRVRKQKTPKAPQIDFEI